ncbi:MAG: hypothetical protein AB7S65_04100 [Sulfuricurvum sp.]
MGAKENYIKHLQNARTEHVRWVNNIKLLISGVDITEKTIPLNPAESPFGKWFYSKALLLSVSNSRNVLEDSEEIFLRLHDVYMKIYPIYFGKKNKGILGGLFSKNTSTSTHETELAQRYYEEIIALSDQLKNKLRIFETQLHATPSEKFEELARFDEEELKPIEPANVVDEENSDDQAYFYGTRCR